MEKAKRSNRRIINFLEVSQELLKNTKKETNFTYALTRVRKGALAAYVEFDAALADINNNRASTDEKGNFVNGPSGGFVFKPKPKIERDKEHRKLLDTEVEIGIYFAQPIKDTEDAVIPFDITLLQREALEGFVLPEAKEPEAEEPKDDSPPPQPNSLT